MAKPIAAIVGRPNVGKSTLFNRIIRKRQAIVDAVAGVTRDRHYSPAEWSGREFILVDTGGYMVQFKDEIDRGIRFQVEEAIDEADLVLFLTDVNSGITKTEQIMADMLLKSGKPTLLLANKADSMMLEAEAAVFNRLGFGEPVSISALHGRGIGDMLDVIISRLPENESIEPESGEISIAVLGRPNVGKSSLVNALIGKEKMLVTEIPGTTRDSIDSTIKRYGQVYRLIDTAGLRKRRKVHENIEYYSTLRTIRSINRCQLVIIMVDAREGVQHQDLKIIDMAIESQRGIILALNKWDLIDKDDKTFIAVEREVKDILKGNDFIVIVSTSAVTKQRVYKLLDICKKVYADWNRRVETSALNKMLQDAVEKNHPPSSRGKFVSIKYCTQTGVSPPVITFFVNKPRGLPEQYRRYLARQVRESFGFSGVPLKLQFKRKSESE